MRARSGDRLLENYAQLPEPDEERLLTWLRLLDGHLSRKGDYATVRDLYVRFVAAVEQRHGAQHPETVALRSRLAMLNALI